MKTVFRNDDGKIIYVYYDTIKSIRRYLTPDDYFTAMHVPITKEMLNNYDGQIDTNKRQDNLLEVLNGEWSIEDYRLSILSYNDLIESPIVTKLI